MKLMDILTPCRQCHQEVIVRGYDVDALKPAKCPARHLVHPEAKRLTGPAATEAQEAIDREMARE